MILAKTVKGYGMGEAGEAQNITHQKKKLDDDDLQQFRDRFRLPVTDEQIRDLAYYKPAEDSEEMKYLQDAAREARRLLSDSAARASSRCRFRRSTFFKAPARGERRARVLDHDGVRADSDGARARQEHRQAHRADRARRGAHVRHGRPVPPDRHLFFARPALHAAGRRPAHVLPRGQEGPDARGGHQRGRLVSARGSPPGTAYSTHGVQMVPFYIYYSMFGFQRVGDFAWAAGDMRSRGFLLGGTAGRTTLAGEGLQHQDGHSQLVATTIPNCVAYDPSYAYELAVIIQDGLRRMCRRAGRHLLLHHA